jgi:hypothetical protein
MKKHILIVMGFLLIGISSSSFPATHIISCPAVGLQHYGKTSYYDRRIGKTWNLNWHSQQHPVWKNVSIPETRVCGKGMASNGMRLNYQCSVFQCKSDAVIAQLGQTQAFKCFSSYVSTQNKFYCDGFNVE